MYFTGILRMFSQNTQWNTKHSLYTFHISCKFCVLLLPRKNKPWNSLTFYTKADPCAKCKKNSTKYTAINFLFFALSNRFHIFCNKCIVGLTRMSIQFITSENVWAVKVTWECMWCMVRRMLSQNHLCTDWCKHSRQDEWVQAMNLKAIDSKRRTQCGMP